jgi:CxxC motif-containing protein
MLKRYTCIVCPNGCEVEAEVQEGKIVSLKGNLCPRGDSYVRQEMTNPKRTITSSVLVEGGVLPLASVRLTNPIPKGKIFDVMDEIKKIELKAPVTAGTVLIKDVLGLKSDLIVTKDVNVSTCV